MMGSEKCDNSVPRVEQRLGRLNEDADDLCFEPDEGHSSLTSMRPLLRTSFVHASYMVKEEEKLAVEESSWIWPSGTNVCFSVRL